MFFLFWKSISFWFSAPFLKWFSSTLIIIKEKIFLRKFNLEI
jgi:hypothetical protein